MRLNLNAHVYSELQRKVKRARKVSEPVEAKPPKLHPANSSGNLSVTAGIKALPQQQETKMELKRVSVFYSQVSLIRR